MIAKLGYIVFQVLDFGIDEDEERSLNPELESLIKRMIALCKYYWINNLQYKLIVRFKGFLILNNAYICYLLLFKNLIFYNQLRDFLWWKISNEFILNEGITPKIIKFLWFSVIQNNLFSMFYVCFILCIFIFLINLHHAH